MAKKEKTKLSEKIKETKKILKAKIKEAERDEAKKQAEPDIRKLVERIVDSIENKKKMDILAYDALTKRFPQTKNTLTELISELRIFSIYDDEPHTVNFDYSAYLKQIEELADIG